MLALVWAERVSRPPARFFPGGGAWKRRRKVNNAFYRLPELSAFKAWAEAVGDGFVFAVKASRYLTHVRRLQGPEEPVQRLVERASGLGAKLGPVLLQLPPNLGVDLDALDRTGVICDCTGAGPSRRLVMGEQRYGPGPTNWLSCGPRRRRKRL